MTLRENHTRLVKKELSARELLDSYIATIDAKESDVHAFLEVYAESARVAADEIDAAIANGDTVEILAGEPIAVKDSILIEGKPTTAASNILKTYKAVYDAFVIEQLKKHRSIFIGKTNLDEFAMGSSTETSYFGTTKNPHDAERVPGGSSGGSAAAVAAGMVPIAIGSDTGGSIRQPAAFCGVVGFKPSYGRVSRRGLIAMASSLDQIGTIATTVDDAEILFRAIEGRDEMDSTSVEVNESVKDKKEYVIGVPREFFGEGLDPKVKEVIDVVAKKAEGGGFKLQEVSLPSVEYALACYYIIMPAEASSNLARYDGIRYGERASADEVFDIYRKTRASGFGTEVKRRIAVGTYVLSHGYYDAYYVRAGKVRTLIQKDFEDVFRNVDVLLTPTTPTLPFKIGNNINDPLAMYMQDIYTVPVNLAGLPAISLPAGLVDGLPVGLQLIGPRFKDYTLLGIAKKIEELIS